MDVIIRPTAGAAADLVTQIIGKEVRLHPGLTLGLATGCTMEAVYAGLVRLHRKEGLDFSRCRTFNLDEYVGLPADDRQSYRSYMNQHLFRQVNINPDQTHVPNGMAIDLEAECANYERLIAEAGGIDLQLLGIGWTGHLGFNEPLTALRSRTQVKTLSRLTREQNAPMFGSADQVPHRAITMGVGTILDSRRCILLATGEDKAEIIAKAIEGPVTSMVAASALQMHPNCIVILDEDAGAKLVGIDDYRMAFENEPQWDAY
jgi:glucosamine-6-phosphate deaminase